LQHQGRAVLTALSTRLSVEIPLRAKYDCVSSYTGRDFEISIHLQSRFSVFCKTGDLKSLISMDIKFPIDRRTTIHVLLRTVAIKMLLTVWVGALCRMSST